MLEETDLMRVACLTVTYPGVESYFEEFYQSFLIQTNSSADLVIMNDGLGDLGKLISESEVQPVLIQEVKGSPAQNRMTGLQACKEAGYDVIICADADETMHEDRIGDIIEYFITHPQAELVFNNSAFRDESGYFDLNYKSRLTWQDILDFNVLGYGAMNLRSSVVPFFQRHADTGVEAFDWWLAMVYLLSHESVDFLAATSNHYRKHTDNFVGPLTNIKSHQIQQALVVKTQFYKHLSFYCYRFQIHEAQEIVRKQLDSLEETNDVIQFIGFEWYSQTVKKYLETMDRIYWWQPAVLMDELVKNRVSA